MSKLSIIDLLKAGKVVEKTEFEITILGEELRRQGIEYTTWFERTEGHTKHLKLVFPKITYHHKYIFLHRWLLEIDEGGTVVGRITAAPIMDRFEHGSHPYVYWDSRPGQQFNLDIGDQWIPPEGYPN